MSFVNGQILAADGKTVLLDLTSEGILAAQAIQLAVCRINTNIQLTRSQSVVWVDSTNQNITITLPAASDCKPGYCSFVYVVIFAGLNSVSVAPLGTDLINGSNTPVNFGHFPSHEILISDGISQWQWRQDT